MPYIEIERYIEYEFIVKFIALFKPNFYIKLIP